MTVRVYISVDMEGITGVAVGKHVTPGEKEYDRFRRLMTQDANAAIEGALAAGATEVVVSDGHGPMTNLLIEELHPAARLLSGSNKLLGQMEAIDRGFDVAFFVGYHQREGGGDGVMNHTYLGRFVYEIRLNGEPVDEPYLNSGSVMPDRPAETVPPGHVFVMGDNRTGSQDSRIFGPIPVEDLVGRAFVTIWPIDRWGGL